MNIALLLLSSDDCYVSQNGELPVRPSFDKKLLTETLRGQNISPLGFQTLPPSIQKIVKIGSSIDGRNFPVTIPEIALADLLIISRSQEPLNGKKFRLDNFQLLAKSFEIEIWKKL